MAKKMTMNNFNTKINIKELLPYKFDKGADGLIRLKVVVDLNKLAKKIMNQFNAGGSDMIPKLSEAVCVFIYENKPICEVKLDPIFRQEFDSWK